jgi:hypothetical protein
LTPDRVARVAPWRNSDRGLVISNAEVAPTVQEPPRPSHSQQDPIATADSVSLAGGKGKKKKTGRLSTSS